MRPLAFASLAVLTIAAGASPALGQAKKDGKTSSGPEIRYFTSIGGIMDDQADTILKETRNGGRVTTAELDVCYPSPGNPDRKDRFVATLAVEGQKLSGTTESIEGKQPVSVALNRRTGSGGVSFDGKVTIGSQVSTISSADNTDISEKEFRTGQEADDEIIASPADYTNASPEAVAVRLKPAAVADFVNTLRGQNLEVSLTSLLPSCTELRRGEQVVHMNIDPERAPDFVSKLRATPGVILAGWTSGKLDMERTIRFAGGDWREGGKLARERIAASLSSTIAKAINATATGAKWNEDNGELKLGFRRPNGALPGLNLTQTFEFTAMVAPEKPGADRLLLWLSYPVITTSDESSGPRLKIVDSSDSNGEDAGPIEDGDALTAMARVLKAQRWDSENTTWK